MALATCSNDRNLLPPRLPCWTTAPWPVILHPSSIPFFNWSRILHVSTAPSQYLGQTWKSFLTRIIPSPPLTPHLRGPYCTPFVGQRPAVAGQGAFRSRSGIAREELGSLGGSLGGGALHR